MRIKKINPVILVLILLSLTPLIWFWGRGDVLLNGVDTNFPLDPLLWFKRRFFVWNPINNAGADFSSSTSGLFFHLIQVIPYLLGFSLKWVQIVSLLFWSFAIIFSSYFFSRVVFGKKRLVQLVFVVFYSFNIYLFNTWENVKVANLALVTALPLASGLFILLKKGTIKRTDAVFYSVLVGVILSGSGINPSYFISFFLTTALFFLGVLTLSVRERNIRKRLIDFFAVVVPIILVNLFWILPSLSFIFTNISARESIAEIGFTNWTDSLSKDTSLFNVLRLQGLWDWYAFDSVTGLPLYIPYVVNFFYNFPFIIYSLLIPSLVLLSLVLHKKENKYLFISFSFLLVVGVLLGAGTHSPTGYVFRLLLNNIPFFSLFRSPWYIFTPMVFFSIAGILALFFDTTKALSDRKSPIISLAIGSFALVMIAGNLLYTYPQVSGKIFRPKEKDSFFINFPDYVLNSQEKLDNLGEGRLIGYPDDEIERFEWGYRGVQPLTTLISNKETLSSPLNAPDSGVASLIKHFYLSLKRGETEKYRKIAKLLNIDSLLYKNDQSSLSPERKEELNDYTKNTVGEWDLYNFASDKEKIYIAEASDFAYSYTHAEDIISSMDEDSVLLNPSDSVVNDIRQLSLSSGNIILAENSQRKSFEKFIYSPSNIADRIRSYEVDNVSFKFNIPVDGEYQPKLEKYAVEKFGFKLTGNLALEVNGTTQEWKIEKVDDSYIYFDPILLEKDEYEISLALDNNNLIINPDFIENLEFDTKGVANLSTVEDEGEKALGIYNTSGEDASAVITISDFDPLSSYLIELEYRQIYGNNASVLVHQATDKTLVKTQVERMPNHPEWKHFSFYFEPVKTKSEIEIELAAPKTKDPLGTKILYNNLKVHKVFSNNMLFVKEGATLDRSAKVVYEQVSPVEYKGRIESDGTSDLIVFSENYSPKWNIDIFSDNEKLDLEPKHFSANTYANAWFIDKAPGNYRFKITYTPQKLFNIGMLLSTVTLFTSLLLYFRGRKN